MIVSLGYLIIQNKISLIPKSQTLEFLILVLYAIGFNGFALFTNNIRL